MISNVYQFVLKRVCCFLFQNLDVGLARLEASHFVYAADARWENQATTRLGIGALWRNNRHVTTDCPIITPAELTKL